MPCEGPGRFPRHPAPAWPAGNSAVKLYTGYRTPRGCVVKVHGQDGSGRDLDLRLDLRAHSPAGAEWGYGGSGPAQLALGLAADVLGDDELALRLYQDLKFRLVGRLAHDGWSLSEGQIRDVLKEIQERRGRSP
jgi:hypothetical protein